MAYTHVNMPADWEAEVEAERVRDCDVTDVKGELLL